MKSIVLLIPAWNPQPRLTGLIRDCQALGLDQITVIDDGSDASCEPVFSEIREAGALLVRHETNRGKGYALRTGIRASIASYGKSVAFVTADADGQHLPEDILRVARELLTHPDALILGERSFSGEDVPKKSRWGNRFSSLLFRLTTGVSCADTQTGLRGIPNSLIDLALEEDGDRYEYEMNFLSDAVSLVPLYPVPITTVYENGNRGSHYRPVRDSMRVIGRFLRFLCASLIGAACDLLLFAVLLTALTGAISFYRAAAVATAAIGARILSGIVNFLLNKYWSFRSHANGGGEAVRYAILFVSLMAASAIGTTLLSAILIPVAAKLIVDSLLFLVSFRVSRRFVFRLKGGISHETKKPAQAHAPHTLGNLF